MYSSLALCTIAIVALLGLTSGYPSDVKEVFAKTIFAEARGEPLEGQKWVAWVIKNRSFAKRSYWCKGGCSVRDVCLHPYQFECWNGVQDIQIPANEKKTYDAIKKWSDALIYRPKSEDITGGCMYYNNPAKEGFPAWTNNVKKVRKIGGHQFYKDP